MTLAKKIIVVVVMGISLLFAVIYFQYSRSNIIESLTEKYQQQSDLQYKALINNLKEKKTLIGLLAQQIQYDRQFDVANFSSYLTNLNLSEQYSEICLIIPEQQLSFSTREGKESYCQFFDELSLDQVINLEGKPRLILSEHVSKQSQNIYISIITDLNDIIEADYKLDFDQYLLVFDSLSLMNQYYGIVDGLLWLDQKPNIENALKHQFYRIDAFNDIQLLYLSAFKQKHLISNYSLVPLLVAFLIFVIPTLVCIYIAKLLDRKALADKALKQKETEIAYSQKFLSLILENYPEIIFVKDQYFKITYANAHFLNMYPEHQRDKVIGFTTLEQYKPAEVEQFLAMDRKALREGYSEVMETISFPDNTRRTLFTKKVRFTGLDGQPYILGTANDVTQRELLLKQLEYSNEELKQFAYRTSHDLKSPLLNIQNLTSFIKDDIEEGNLDEANKNLDKIDGQAVKLFNLVTDILTLTKADYLDGEHDAININALIHDVFQNFEDLIAEHNIKISTNIAENIQLWSSATRLKQVLENLISNAVKYHDPNKQERLVWIKVEQEADEIVLTVKDNGIGIPKGKEAEVFNLFTRFNVKRAEGSGLGLAIVKKHVEKLNGRISVQTKHGATLFTICLPLK